MMFWQPSPFLLQSAPNEEDKKPDVEEASTAADSSPSEVMLLNPNVLTEFKLGGSEEVFLYSNLTVSVCLCVCNSLFGVIILVCISCLIFFLLSINRRSLQMKRWWRRLVHISWMLFSRSLFKTFVPLRSRPWMVKHWLMHSILMG